MSRRLAKQYEIAQELRAALQRAVACHQAGDFAEAERRYRAILAVKPDHFDALHHLGVLERQRGRAEAGCRLLSRALRINPLSAEAHSNLGNALQAANRHQEALASYARALAIKPDYAGALNNRGNALQALGRYAEALASYDKALAIEPDLADALNNRGAALAALERFGEAIASYDRALAARPGYVDALNNRGAALQALERLEEAIASYDQTLVLRPEHALALNNRGNALQALHRHDEALASYARALAINPRYADALNNRGNALRALNRLEEALASYDEALAIKPDHAGALNNRGHALQTLNRCEEALASYDKALAIKPALVDALNSRGAALAALNRFTEAIASYDKALAIRPDYADALSNRGHALQALNRHQEALANYEKVVAITPDYAEARGMRLHASMHCCEWRDHEDEAKRLIDEVRTGKRSAVPFALLSVSDSPADQLLCASTHVRARCPASPTPLWTGQPYAHDRIRLAYLSADFRDHATAFLTAELFERHDALRFDTTAVSFGPEAGSQIRPRLEGAFERFIDVRNKSDAETASLLRELEIDIAVDLNGFTKGARTNILASRPAPVQVNYLGYPGTMGAGYIDYILADRVVIPEEDRACYTEKVVYLPDTYQVNDSKRRIAERTPARAEVGLPEEAFVFCSFNGSYKITPAVFETWMRLLRAVSGSVLWLAESNASVPGNLRREAKARGIAPERLVFAGHLRLEEHLARYRLANVFLDTLPCNAHTTASDALWAGLPVVTCCGSTFAGRVAGSLLSAIGLPELIARSLEEYHALALKLATDASMLAEIRQRLARNRQTFPLFDSERFRRHIEAAYVEMWQRHQRGEPPAGFAVEPIDQ